MIDVGSCTQLLRRGLRFLSFFFAMDDVAREAKANQQHGERTTKRD
jgi:hypothetical protein